MILTGFILQTIDCTWPVLDGAAPQDVVQHHREDGRAPSLVNGGLIANPEVDI